MNQSATNRIPVRFGAPGPDDALLVEAGLAAASDRTIGRFRLPPRLPGHGFGCTCCVPRGPVAEALARLFLARARGEVPWFQSVAVIATPAGEAAVRAALSEDQVCAGRFRPAED